MVLGFRVLGAKGLGPGLDNSGLVPVDYESGNHFNTLSLSIVLAHNESWSCSFQSKFAVTLVLVNLIIFSFKY